MMPSGWEKKTLGEIVKIVSGDSPSKFQLEGAGKIPFVKVEDLNNCNKYQTLSRFYTNEKKRGLIPPQSVLFPKRGAAIMNNKVRINATNLYMDTNLMALIPNEEAILGEFLYYKITYQQLHKIADTSTIPQINNKHIEPLEVDLPPISEQAKIAKILSVWDEAIEQMEKIIKQKIIKKKSFERTYFFDEAPSKSIPLSQIFERVNKKNINLESENVLTISAQNGLVNQKDFFKKNVASKNTTNYYLLKKGDFAYNKSYSSGYPLGAIKPLENYEHGIVSPLYICFCLKQNKLRRVGFFKHFFESGAFDLQISTIAQEGARNHGLLNVSVVDFFNLHIPDYSEIQIDSLSAFFDCVDKELLLYRKKLSALKLQKQGLMQQLITGMRRVKA